MLRESNKKLNPLGYIKLLYLSFSLIYIQVENVKQRCLPNALNYPMLEEYDFRNDTVSNALYACATKQR